MPINKLIIENFKGIRERQEFPIRPLTIFCGPNSSGKSSCIHALAALAQTTKLTATQVPIVLDDEYAQVHLGRFLDVVHSKSMRDSFTIGVQVENAEGLIGRPSEAVKTKNRTVHAEFDFRVRATTQEVYIESANLATGEKTLRFTRKNVSTPEYSITSNGSKMPFKAISSSRFGLQIRLSFGNDGEPAPDEVDSYILTESVNRALTTELRRTFYLGPFRQGPLRKYSTRGSQPTEVGAAGEAAVTMLANEFMRSKTKHPNLAKVSNWVGQLGLGKKVLLSPIAKTDLVDLSVTLADGAQLPLPDLGYGVSQVLPVLVQCAFAPKNSTLLFEQPELHLHDNAARGLAGVFIDVIREKNVHIVAETHSRNLFLQVMNEVNAGRISADDVVLYDVTRADGRSVFRTVNLIKDGAGRCEADHPWARDIDA